MVLEKQKKNRSVEQNRQPRNRPHKYSYLILTKEQRQYNGTIFSTHVASNWTPHAKKMNLDRPSPFIKFKSKWIIDLNVKCKTKTTGR